jgi:hypothetical protein
VSHSRRSPRARASRGGAWRTALLLAAGAAATTAIGFALGWAWLLPFLGAAVPYPIFLRRVARKRYAAAVGWVLLWALFQSVAVSLAVAWAPERAAQVVHSGPKYSAEMLNWVRTGEGAEGSPRLFLPIHLRHYVGLCVLSVVTAGSAALVLGTWLLNYMSYYVTDLVRASSHPVTATLLGWPVWSIIRVAGFVVTGAALTGFSLSLYNRLQKRTRAVKFPARVFLIGFALVVLDAAIKATLAPFWQRAVLRTLGE